MTELAMVYLKKKIDKLDYDVFIKLVLHDEIWVDCPDENSEEVKTILEECMCKAGQVIIPIGIIGADAEISKVWKK
jgi:DNA polymerase I-like protein with 3'-5' exonuclease and polymerase domains